MRRTPVHVLTLAATVVAALGSTARGAEEARIGDYVFSLNGKPLHPQIIHLHGEPGKPAPGDVFYLHPFLIALGEERDLHFRQASEKGIRDSLKLDSKGKSRWVAMAASRLSHMSEEEVRGLWAVSIESQEGAPWGLFHQVDPERVSITVSIDLPREGRGVLPTFPRGIRRLSLDLHVWADRIDYRGLAELQKLEFLDLQGFCGGSLDLAILGHATRLRSLNLYGGTLEHIQVLATMKELRFLNLSWDQRLRGLDPLESLERLREIRLFDTAVTREEAERFQRTHPGCKVLRAYDELVRNDINGADHVRLTVRDLDSEEENQKPQILEVSDRQAVARLAECIHVDRRLCSWSCGCVPYLRIEFSRGEQSLATATYHHGHLVGFSWPGDLILTLESREQLVRWLSEHGVKKPLEELQAEHRRARADQNETRRATVGMSQRLGEAFGSNDEKAFFLALREEVPPVGDRTRLLLRVLGAGNGPLGKLQWQALLAYAGLRALPREELLRAAEEAVGDADRQLRRGAVRFWETAGSFLLERSDDSPKNQGVVVIAGGEADDPLRSRAFRDAGRLRAAIVSVEAEARSAQVRELALTRLRDWAAELPATEVQKRLLAGLRDPHPGVRRRALLVAGELARPEAEGILLDVLNGRAVEPVPLGELPADEAEDVDDGYLDAGEQASDAELAALALGYLASEKAKPQLEAKALENDFHRVALALAGDAARVTVEDFRCGNQARQLAAVEAVVRAKGRRGLEASLGYKQASHWWEEDRVLERLRAMLLREKAPGEDLLNSARDLNGLRVWFASHGKAYLSRFEKE